MAVAIIFENSLGVFTITLGVFTITLRSLQAREPYFFLIVKNVAPYQ